jgi:hypothetical protein
LFMAQDTSPIFEMASNAVDIVRLPA